VISDGAGYARALVYNSAIVQDSLWADTVQVLIDGGTTCTSQYKGYWLSGSDLYLGLRFTNNNNIYYAWARIAGTTLKAYAYNSVANQFISAGDGFPQGEPRIQWQRSLGGSDDEIANSIQQTTDGGYIVAGISSSDDGDVSGNYGGFSGTQDCWVIKLSSAGNIEWQECLGGTDDDQAYSIQQTTDGGYIVAGHSGTDDGETSGYTGGSGGYLIIKLNSNGIIKWQKSFGGSQWDEANSIQQTTDSGYIVAGSSSSNDGDVSGNHGANDCWVVKLNESGNIEWQKSLGGSQGDLANSIRQTTDGGYIMAGYTQSNDGDVSGNHGNNDYWVVKLDGGGNVEWQKTLGGSNFDEANSIQQTADGGYIVAGWSNSNDGDVSGNHGDYDYWVVKLNNNGNIEWQKSLGGSNTDNATSIQQTADGGYIVAGYVWSSDGDVRNNHGPDDYWVVKLDNTGNIIWQKCLGGTTGDNASSIQQTADGGYIVAGQSISDDYDVTGNHGGYDMWIVKLGADAVLPLRLISFTGILENNTTKLNWQTSNEINTADFIVERSNNANNFSAIGKVNAQQAYSITYSYNYIDDKPLQGINYYRLKIEDKDGRFTYSNIVHINFDKHYSLSVSPVPAHDAVTIAGAENFTSVQFIDASGRIVKQFGKMPDNLFPIADLTKGIYFIRLVSGSDSRIFKRIKE
jgi:Secretion system C-terminal sorting domain